MFVRLRSLCLFLSFLPWLWLLWPQATVQDKYQTAILCRWHFFHSIWNPGGSTNLCLSCWHLSHLNYCNLLLVDASECAIRPVRLIQNAAAQVLLRFIRTHAGYQWLLESRTCLPCWLRPILHPGPCRTWSNHAPQPSHYTLTTPSLQGGIWRTIPARCASAVEQSDWHAPLQPVNSQSLPSSCIFLAAVDLTHTNLHLTSPAKWILCVRWH